MGKTTPEILDFDTARGLYSHMLKGEVPDLELGGVLIALRIKGEGEAEMLGFYEAMKQHGDYAHAAARQADADCHSFL
ncbi:glycosyl transferase family protein [Cedecea neteri]|uniref:Glycosyl transferase family protein n=1 Tax=Cedecea neteri TaxID=158822 RepID=A0A2X2T7F1_9ENTR|nr:glycosyl transferase family protein [Cedecea neteri]